MKRVYLFSVSLLVLLSVNVLSVRADVIGTYIAESNTSTVAGSTGYIGLAYTDQTPSIIVAPGVTNVPPAKNGYAIMEVYGIGANGSGTLTDSDGENYSIYNYTGYIGGSHYFYIKPGTYTVKAIGTSGNYIYIDINGMKKNLSEGTSFTIPSVGSSISIVFSTKPI